MFLKPFLINIYNYMLSYNDLKVGVVFIYEGAPYEVISFATLRKQQRKPVAQTQIKNLISGKILDRNFHMNENFEEAEVEKRPVMFLYSHRDDYWFSEVSNPNQRFSLKREILGPEADFTKQNTEVTGVYWDDEIINVIWPIKAILEIKETVPGEKGNTTSGGTKAATLETGAIVQVPLFINKGDVIRVNTVTGEYAERVEKSTSGF